MISGVEYQSGSSGIFPSAAHDQNVPCARCYTQRSAVVMIPSRRSCPTGWSKEYEGEHIHRAMKYIIRVMEYIMHNIGRMHKLPSIPQ